MWAAVLAGRGAPVRLTFPETIVRSSGSDASDWPTSGKGVIGLSLIRRQQHGGTASLTTLILVAAACSSDYCLSAISSIDWFLRLESVVLFGLWQARLTGSVETFDRCT